MHNTVFARVRNPDAKAIEASVTAMASTIAAYVPGYRLVLCEVDGDRVTVMLEVASAGDVFPAYAGNLDIMTAAAAHIGDALAERIQTGRAAA